MSRQELLELQNQIIERQNDVIRRLIEEISHYENFTMSSELRESMNEVDSLFGQLRKKVRVCNLYETNRSDTKIKNFKERKRKGGCSY